MFKTRIYFLAGVLGLMYLTAMGRLAYLQLWKGGYYREVQARNNRSEQLVPGVRKDITTRDGVVVAHDSPSLDISVVVGALKLETLKLEEVCQVRESYVDPVKESFKDQDAYEAAFKQNKERREAALDQLSERLVSEPWVLEVALRTSRTKEEVATNLFKAMDMVGRKWARARDPQTMLRGIDEATWTALRAVQEDQFEKNNAALAVASLGTMDNSFTPQVTQQIKGLVCTHSVHREYPQGKFLAHVLGFNSEMAPNQMAQLREDGVLTDHLDARTKVWTELKERLDDRQASIVTPLLGNDPRDMDLAELMTGLRKLDPLQRRTVSVQGLSDPVRWSAQPPRVILTEPEKVWMMADGDDMYRKSTQACLTDTRIGETGIECWYNQFLRGKHTLKYGLSLDKTATNLAFSDNAPEQNESGLRLTIDSHWQKAAEDVLRSQAHPAAIVVMNCRTGEILALASFPDFDPNFFTPPRDGVERQKQIKAILEDTEKPLLNRACSDQYPLGSIMKSLVAAVALEKGLTNETETFDCPGYLQIGKYKYHCDGHRSHGRVNITEALRRSCNVFFYHQGARVGVEELGLYAHRIGFGQRTGIDLPAEVGGIFPDKPWRMKAYPNSPWDQSWSMGKDFHLAIGQGYLAVTPLQACELMSVLANGGYAVTPHLNRDAVLPPSRQVGFSPRTLAIVRQGLDECVNFGTPGARGTAYTPFHDNSQGPMPVRVVGKTSTADVGSTGQTPHAWFAGYAPAENPEISFAVFVANAGHGGEIAAPLAAKMIRKAWPQTRN